MVKRSNLTYFLIVLFWILLSLRIYPSNITKTIFESLKMFVGSGLWGLGVTLIMNGLLFRFTKRSLTREQFIKMILGIAFLTSFFASLEHYFRIR